MTRLVVGNRGRRLVPALALLFTGVVFSGCGGRDPDELPTVAASGTVTYKDKPVEKGTIHFQPRKGRPASGVIDGGKFSLSTYQPGDGAVVGKHDIAVEVTEEVKMKDGDTGVKYLIPEKYSNHLKSGINVDIPPGGDKNIQINLK